MKTSKICLVIFCLLHFRAVGMPEFRGAVFFMKKIPLSQGMFALVDDEDFETLSKFKWSIRAAKNTDTVYAARTVYKDGKFFTVRMHRFVMGVTDSETFVDHKNRNGLDNQKENLRLCNRFQNATNRRPNKGSTSKYLGVHFCKNRSKWVAQIEKNNKRHSIGVFHSEIEAAQAYNKKAEELHGEFSNLNKI